MFALPHNGTWQGLPPSEIEAAGRGKSPSLAHGHTAAFTSAKEGVGLSTTAAKPLITATELQFHFTSNAALQQGVTSCKGVSFPFLLPSEIPSMLPSQQLLVYRTARSAVSPNRTWSPSRPQPLQKPQGQSDQRLLESAPGRVQRDSFWQQPVRCDVIPIGLTLPVMELAHTVKRTETS